MRYFKLTAKLLAILFIFLLVKPLNALFLALLDGLLKFKETISYEMNRSPDIKKAYKYVIAEFNKESIID